MSKKFYVLEYHWGGTNNETEVVEGFQSLDDLFRSIEKHLTTDTNLEAMEYRRHPAYRITIVSMKDKN
jgi:hypothetical protein